MKNLIAKHQLRKIIFITCLCCIFNVFHAPRASALNTGSSTSCTENKERTFIDCNKNPKDCVDSRDHYDNYDNVSLCDGTKAQYEESLNRYYDYTKLVSSCQSDSDYASKHKYCKHINQKYGVYCGGNRDSVPLYAGQCIPEQCPKNYVMDASQCSTTIQPNHYVYAQYPKLEHEGKDGRSDAFVKRIGINRIYDDNGNDIGYDYLWSYKGCQHVKCELCTNFIDCAGAADIGYTVYFGQLTGTLTPYSDLVRLAVANPLQNLEDYPTNASAYNCDSDYQTCLDISPVRARFTTSNNFNSAKASRIVTECLDGSVPQYRHIKNNAGTTMKCIGKCSQTCFELTSPTTGKKFIAGPKDATTKCHNVGNPRLETVADKDNIDVTCVAECTDPCTDLNPNWYLYKGRFTSDSCNRSQIPRVRQYKNIYFDDPIKCVSNTECMDVCKSLDSSYESIAAACPIGTEPIIDHVTTLYNKDIYCRLGCMPINPDEDKCYGSDTYGDQWVRQNRRFIWRSSYWHWNIRPYPYKELLRYATTATGEHTVKGAPLGRFVDSSHTDYTGSNGYCFYTGCRTTPNSCESANCTGDTTTVYTQKISNQCGAGAHWCQGCVSLPIDDKSGGTSTYACTTPDGYGGPWCQTCSPTPCEYNNECGPIYQWTCTATACKRSHEECNEDGTHCHDVCDEYYCSAASCQPTGECNKCEVNDVSNPDLGYGLYAFPSVTACSIHTGSDWCGTAHNSLGTCQPPTCRQSKERNRFTNQFMAYHINADFGTGNNYGNYTKCGKDGKSPVPGPNNEWTGGVYRCDIPAETEQYSYYRVTDSRGNKCAPGQVSNCTQSNGVVSGNCCCHSGDLQCFHMYTCPEQSDTHPDEFASRPDNNHLFIPEWHMKNGGVNGGRCGKIVTVSNPSWLQAGGNLANASATRPTNSNIYDSCPDVVAANNQSRDVMSISDVFDTDAENTQLSYDYLAKRVEVEKLSTCTNSTADANQANDYVTICRIDGNASSSNYPELLRADRNVVIFVTAGNFTIDTNIETDEGYFKSIIAKNTIIVDSGVGDLPKDAISGSLTAPAPKCPQKSKAHLQGVFIAKDFSFPHQKVVDSDMVAFNGNDLYCDRQLIIAGSLIKYGSGNLNLSTRTFRACTAYGDENNGGWEEVKTNPNLYIDFNSIVLPFVFFERADFNNSAPPWMKSTLTERYEVR